jgi:hypothetical protein
MIDSSDWQLTFPLSYSSHTPRYENSYKLVNENTGQQIAQGGDFGDRKTYSTNLCLPQTCYALTVEDSYGDGLNSGGNGGYSLSVDGVEIASADSNDSFELITHKFGACSNVPAPTPAAPTPAAPTPAAPTRAPTRAPTPAPTRAPTPAPTPATTTSAPVGGGGAPITCAPMTLQFITDSYPSENEFYLFTAGEGEFLWSEDDFLENRTYNYNACVDSGVCVVFAFFDTFGDGLEAPGKIKLTFKGDVIVNGRNFGRDYTVRLCNE